MSKLYEPSFAHPLGALICPGGIGVTMARGTAAPTASAAGYAKGCIFQDTTNGAIYMNTGTVSSATWVRQDSEQTLTTGAGVGITSGTGTVYKTSVIKIGNIIHTTIYIDLTGLASIATDGDIIGVNGGGAAHIGRITAAQNGTIESLEMVCTETPAGGLADIDLFRATVATGVQDDAISGITGQATTGAINITAINTVKCATAVPAANDYLYLCAGAGSGAGTYTAGKLIIRMIGY